MLNLNLIEYDTWLVGAEATGVSGGHGKRKAVKPLYLLPPSGQLRLESLRCRGLGIDEPRRTFYPSIFSAVPSPAYYMYLCFIKMHFLLKEKERLCLS